MARELGQDSSARARTAPHPDDPRKPDEVRDIRTPSWKYVLRKTIREFMTDQATDLAAALTYFGVLAIFPALLAFVSIIGLFGDAEATTAGVLDLLGGLLPQNMLDAVREPVARLAASPAAGFAFVTGVVGALWSASGYVGAFSRAMNRIYGIEEGRPFWKLRPMTLAVTVLAVVAMVIAAVLVTASGPIAERIGEALGLGERVLLAWNIVRWPVLAAIVITLIAVLYAATPNVRQPKFRWMSVGAFVALLIWVIASAGFAFYVANFSSYNETYGSIGGVIVFLLWLWISNNALLFGAELDAELERGRQLQAGIAAEEHIQLPPRDTAASEKKARQHERDLAEGRRLRGAPPEPDDGSEHERLTPKQQAKSFKKQAKRMRRAQVAQNVGIRRPKE